MPNHYHTVLTDTHYWLALKFIPRLNVLHKIQLAKQYSLADLFGSPSTLLKKELTAKQFQAIESPDWTKIGKIIEASEECQSQIVTYGDPNYPPLLKEIYDPPLVLFVQGDISLLKSPQLAIVGSRSATFYGRELAKSFAKQLIPYGLAITSGLALGIDTAAHNGALAAQGKTIAVVASGLDIVYPARNRKLAQEIKEQGGAIVSEFIPSTQPKAGLFPRRNRIISGLSLGVLVAEAELQSGSLITARCALEHNREVFAFPGSIANPQSKGCHWLIKQGAKLVDDIADIVDEFNLTQNFELNLNKIIEKDNNKEKSPKEDLCIKPLLDSVGYDVTPIDAVVSRSKLPIDTVLTQLMMLELRGLVSAVPGGYLRVN